MAKYTLENLFGIEDKVIAVTGAAGILCSEMSKALADLGAKVAVLDLREDVAEKVASEIRDAGGQAIAVKCNVLDKPSIEAACQAVIDKWGQVDVLINGAGGNKKEATTSDEMGFFDLPADAIRFVFELNCVGTILPSQVFAKHMAERKAGQIINLSSMSAFKPLTKVMGYSAAKAAVSNFTEWLSVHMGQNYSSEIRVNALAPGFFLTDQNRFLLTDEKTGELKPRGKTIISQTPAARFGTPDELVSTLVWLLGDGAKFVTGIVVPIDGGFNAFSGV